MNRFKKSFVAALLALASFILAPVLRAQVTPTTIGLVSGIPSNMALNTTSNITSGAITLRQGKGLALAFNLVAQGAGTSNTTFNADVSLDGTNYSTTHPISIIVPNNGTNAVTFWTNIPPTTLDNSVYLRFSQVICLQTNALTNITVLYGIKN